MEEIKRLKKLSRKYQGEKSSKISDFISMIEVKLKLENRPWLVSLIVLAGILVIGIAVSSLFGTPPTLLPTALGYTDGMACFKDSDCQSSFCTLDVDGSRFCAPFGSCVKKEGSNVNIYPSEGTFDTNLIDSDGVGYQCDKGFWSEDPFSNTHSFSRITFTTAGTDEAAYINVPKNAIVREASLYVYGIPSYQVNLEDAFTKADVVSGYSVQAKKIEDESKIVLTDSSGKPIGTYEYNDGIDWLGYDFSITTASVDGKTKLILSARGQDSFAIYAIGRYQASNPKVDIGGNGVNWEHTGKLTSATGPQLIDFTEDLARILPACEPVQGICQIPIKVSSESAGTVILSNLRVVLNSAPVITSVVLDPPVATYGQEVSCHASAEDADNDRIQYRYSWTKNGLPSDVVSNILPPEKLQKGTVWQCSVTPVDGYSEGVKLSSREIHVSGLPDYSPCSAALQCESKYCVNGLCCFSDPCPGDNVCDPGEDGTYDGECCASGDGKCSGGCTNELDNECVDRLTSVDIQKMDVQIVIQSIRNDKSLVVQVVDKGRKPVPSVPIKAVVSGTSGGAASGASGGTAEGAIAVSRTLRLYTNNKGIIAVPVDWGRRVSFYVDVEDVDVSIDVVVGKKSDAVPYKTADLEKIGFGETAETFEVEWTQADLSSKELIITFPEEIIPGEPIIVKVTDSAGRPQAGIPVTLETTEGFVTAITNNLGLAVIQEYAGDPLRVRIEKDGYTIATEEVTVVSAQIGYWALIPILVLIIPLIVFFAFSTARGRIAGFGAKQAPLQAQKPKAPEVPMGMDTSAYAKKLHEMRQNPVTAQILEHIEMSKNLLSQRDYTGAKQEVEFSKKLFAEVSSSLKTDQSRIISSKIASSEKEVQEAHSRQLENLKKTPGAQKVLDHMKFVESRIAEVQKIEADIRKSVNSKLNAVVNSTFVKKHPDAADSLLQEIDEAVRAEIYDEFDGLIAHLNELRNSLLEAKSENVLSMEGMSDTEINRAISTKRKEIESKVDQISGHFKAKTESIQ